MIWYSPGWFMSRKATRTDAPPYLTATLAKGLDVLEALAEREEAGLTELANEIGLSGPTLFRILATLTAAGYVQKSAGRYRVSLKMWELGARAVRRLNLGELARPAMERVVRASDEAAHLAMLQGRDVLIIDKVDAAQAVRVDTYVGQRAPAHCSATGKAILAFEPAHRLSEFLGQPMAGYTDTTITDPQALERELADVRRRGYALNRQEWRREVCAVAVPIRNHANSVVGSLSLTMPTARFIDAIITDRFVPLLMHEAATISAALGQRPRDEVPARRRVGSSA